MARMEACKIGSSERHNEREKCLDYVRKDLSHLNDKEVIEAISSRMAHIRRLYEETFHQKMQSSAQNIQEIVLRINQDTTLEQVKRFGHLCQQEYGLTPLQYYVHKDEGHYDVISGEWIPNLHAHIVVDVTCYEHKKVRAVKKSHGKVVRDENGKPIFGLKDAFCCTIKFNPRDMSRMQDLAAEATGMQRGTPSTVEHLNAVQFKTKCAAEDLRKAIKEKDRVEYEAYQRELDIKSYQAKIEELSLSLSQKGKLTAEAFRDKLIRIMGKSKVERQNEQLIAENSQIKDQMNQVVQGFQQLQRQLTAAKQLLDSKYDKEAKLTVGEYICGVLMKHSRQVSQLLEHTGEPDLIQVSSVISKLHAHVQRNKQQMVTGEIEEIATKERSMELGQQMAEQSSGVMKSWYRHNGAPEEAISEAREQIKEAEQAARKWGVRRH